MRKLWSKSWNKSKQPRKQRKYVYNAPPHVRTRFVNSHLSKELREKYGKRSLRVRVGDSVRIVRGEFKGVSGKVEKVLTKFGKILVEGVQRSKSDGTKVRVKISASNVVITDLDLSDNLRKKKLGVE